MHYTVFVIQYAFVKRACHSLEDNTTAMLVLDISTYQTIIQHWPSFCLSPPELVESGVQNVFLSFWRQRHTVVIAWLSCGQYSSHEHCFVSTRTSKLYYQYNMTFRPGDWGQVKSVCRYKSAKVQILNEIWSDILSWGTWTTSQHWPPMIRTEWHIYWII